MLAVTHIMGGAAAAAYLMIVSPDIQSVSMAAAAVGFGAVGGLIPDIDHPNSKISHTLRPVSALVSLFFSHRGFFHSPILYLMLGMLWAWKYPASEYILWACCLLFGIISHLFLDSLNPQGIPLLFPFSSKHFHIAKIRTGGKGEMLIRVLLGIMAVWMMVIVFQRIIH